MRKGRKQRRQQQSRQTQSSKIREVNQLNCPRLLVVPKNIHFEYEKSVDRCSMVTIKSPGSHHRDTPPRQ